MKPFPMARAVLAATCLAMPATAQITAEDVWASQQAVVAAAGGALQGRLDRKGDRVTIHDHRIVWTLPLGAGEIAIRQDPYDLIELPDGSVAFAFEDDIIAAEFSATIAPLIVDLSGWIGVDLFGAEFVARGEPGTVRYESRADRMDVTVAVAGQTGRPSSVEFVFDT